MRVLLYRLALSLVCFLSFAALALAAPSVGFDSSSSSGPESIEIVSLEVLLSEPSATQVRVPYEVTGGTALNGVDYDLKNGALVFDAGEVSKEINITIYDDGAVEPEETIVVRLGQPENADLGDISEHTFTILDNDSENPNPEALPLVSFSSASSSVSESDTGMSVTVVLSKPGEDSITVNYSFVDVTANAGSDYNGTPGTLTFSPGETSKTISFGIQDDSLNEPEEAFNIVLDNPTNAELGQPAVHSCKIEDNDAVEVNFEAAQAEGDESSSPATAVVELSGPCEQTVTVNYMVGGSAQPSLDYESLPGEVVFEPGSVQKTIEININDDNEIEESETIEITLSYAGDARVGVNNKFTYTIKDNDTPVPYVRFITDTSAVPEDAGHAKIEVSLSEPATTEVTVEYFVAENSSAKPGVDYRLLGNTITFAPGETRKDIELDIINDDMETADKSITIALTNPVNAKIDINSATHTIWKVDDDQKPTTLSLFRQEVPTRDLLRKLIVLGPKTRTVNPGGIAVDNYGNLYISDQGPNRGENEGSILMWPKGSRNVIRIIKNVGLTRPGDIELSKDQRSLIVADPVGIHIFPLGLSLRITNIDPLTGDTRVHVFSEAGEKVEKVSPDGYFHFPGILVPNQGRSVQVIIEHAGLTRRKTVYLGQPGMDGEPFGHTLVNLEF